MVQQPGSLLSNSGYTGQLIKSMIVFFKIWLTCSLILVFLIYVVVILKYYLNLIKAAIDEKRIDAISQVQWLIRSVAPV